MFLIITTTYQGFHIPSTALNHSQPLSVALNQLNQFISVMETISVMNILGHMNSRSSAIAAQTIQRHWRSTPTFTSQLRAEALGNASQLGPEPFGQISLTGDTDFLNLNHSFWRWTESDEVAQVKQSISFSDECLIRENDDKVEATDFHDTPDKSGRLFANTIVSLFGGKVPLYKFFSHRNAPAMEPYFKNAICKLEAGQKVSIWDGGSTKLQPTDKAIAAVKECFVKYNYFMKTPTFPYQKVAVTFGEETKIRPEGDVAAMDIVEQPLLCTIKPFPKTPSLPRVASRTVCGVKMICQSPVAVDDLEARLQKLMNPPYSK